MNSLRRMLQVLALLRPGQSSVDIEQICDQLGYTPPTAYRYVRELNEFGLLVRLPGGYALGPRVIELDLLMRENDPMLEHSRDLMQRLVAQTGMSALLSEFYEDVVITTHEEFAGDLQALRYGRGRRMPLFRSATSRVVLANLSPRRLRRVYDENATSEDVRNLGADWRAFSKAMLEIRRQGYCLSRGELETRRFGLAAPIFDDKSRVLGSLSMVTNEERYTSLDTDALANLVREAATEITRRISAYRRSMAEPTGTGARKSARRG